MEIEDIEEMRQYFTAKAEQGNSLPNVKSVADGTIFYLLDTDGIHTEHIMFNGLWHKKTVDANSQIILTVV